MTSKLIRLYAKNAREITPGSYTTTLDTKDLTDVRAIALKTVTFRNNQYNVYTSGNKKNSVFYYELAGVPYTAELQSDGFYTTVELLNIIQPLIQAQIDISHAGGSVVLELDQYLQKPKITITGVANWSLGSTEQDALNPYLGNTVIHAGIDSETYVFDSFANLSGLKSVTVNVKTKRPSTILNINESKLRYTNSLGVVPVTVPFGALQSYVAQDLTGSKVIFGIPQTLHQLEFKIRDPDGELLTEQTNDLLIEIIVWYTLD